MSIIKYSFATSMFYQKFQVIIFIQLIKFIFVLHSFIESESTLTININDLCIKIVISISVIIKKHLLNIYLSAYILIIF